MKPIKFFLKGERRDKKKLKKMGANWIKVYYMHEWKYHSETPLYKSYILITKSVRVRHGGAHL
jgi:aryl-alcohol dehydrogenase-like predicted oxidoreductase